MARRLLWHSNPPHCRSGYGGQTRLFAGRVNEAGYETAVSAFGGLTGGMLTIDGLPVYPSGHERYSADTLAPNAVHHFRGQHGIVFVLADAWVIPPGKLDGVDVAFWAPVDHDPVPPMVAHALEQSGAVPVAMSRHGERALRAAGFDPLYCPHAVDTAVFRPRDRHDARAASGLREFPEDAFVVGMVANNQGWTPARKGWEVAAQAFAKLRAEHKDAYLYLHTEPYGKLDGVHLPSLLHAAGVPAEAVRFCDPYRLLFTGYSDDDLALLYSGMDVLLNPSLGEGFGLPALEAQACGTPAIVTDFTAMTEVGQVGWHVQGQRTWTNQRSWQMVADVDQIAGSLRHAREIRGRLADEAVAHAQKYDIDRVMADHMLPTLAECERRFDERRTRADSSGAGDDEGHARADAA